MSKRFVKISEKVYVDRRRAMGAVFNLQQMKTYVLLMGGLPPAESDYTLEQTVQLLENGEINENKSV